MELVADGHVVEIGDDPRVQERRLADAALAVEHEHAGIGPAEDPREPLDVVVAAGEQGAVLGAVGWPAAGRARPAEAARRCSARLPLPRGGLIDDGRTAAPPPRATRASAAPPSRTWPTGSATAGAASLRSWRSGGQ